MDTVTKQEIGDWARSRQSKELTPARGADTTDVFDLSDPYDHYLYSLIARDVVPLSTAEEKVGDVVREPDADGRDTRTVSPSAIVGQPTTGKHYSPNLCAECATKLAWEPQCPDCTAGYEGRSAVARAEAGVAKSTAKSSNGGLRNTNSFEEFRARQLPLLLMEPID